MLLLFFSWKRQKRHNRPQKNPHFSVKLCIPRHFWGKFSNICLEEVLRWRHLNEKQVMNPEDWWTFEFSRQFCVSTGGPRNSFEFYQMPLLQIGAAIMDTERMIPTSRYVNSDIFLNDVEKLYKNYIFHWYCNLKCWLSYFSTRFTIEKQLQIQHFSSIFEHGK